MSEKKVWEEKWVTPELRPTVVAVVEPGAIAGSDIAAFRSHAQTRRGEPLPKSDKDNARAKLAAQAPAMARLLLACAQGTVEGDWTLKLVKALRAAGVLP